MIDSVSYCDLLLKATRWTVRLEDLVIMNLRNGNSSAFDCRKKLEKVLLILFCMVLSHSP